MDRTRELLKYIGKLDAGIEIAPYHSPMVPRRDGYRSISLDVFDAETLRSKACEDPNIPAENVARIEDVDLLGTAGDIAELVAASFGDRRFDYIVSSHNLEHLPDPIRFLQGCERVLRSGGVLSLAVPDRRFCFDFYRPVTELSEWLDAYREQRKRPTAAQVFRGESLKCTLNGVGAWMPGVSERPVPGGDLEEAYRQWLAFDEQRDYVDAHCSAFTPASLELLLSDLRFLGLIRLQIVEITGPNGCEFYIHLRNPSPQDEQRIGTDEYYALRAEIMHRAARELVDRSVPETPLQKLAANGRDWKSRGVVAARRNRYADKAIDALKRTTGSGVTP
ncbi:methyltransferase domain-containing protein [Skermania sp. ID1734]|uniref:methyltransferase domain-containing protein n=1 Tax=Skermania sp. ID1734 TaxID=2597516 RepID=UPI00163D5AEE|nr:methyltransferase domain-containing protein [Skermania sp. ID1734]